MEWKVLSSTPNGLRTKSVWVLLRKVSGKKVSCRKIELVLAIDVDEREIISSVDPDKLWKAGVDTAEMQWLEAGKQAAIEAVYQPILLTALDDLAKLDIDAARVKLLDSMSGNDEALAAFNQLMDTFKLTKPETLAEKREQVLWLLLVSAIHSLRVQ